MVPIVARSKRLSYRAGVGELFSPVSFQNLLWARPRRDKRQKMSALKEWTVRVCPVEGGPVRELTITAATPDAARARAEQVAGRAWVVISDTTLKRFREGIISNVSVSIVVVAVVAAAAALILPAICTEFHALGQHLAAAITPAQ